MLCGEVVQALSFSAVKIASVAGSFLRKISKKYYAREAMTTNTGRGLEHVMVTMIA